MLSGGYTRETRKDAVRSGAADMISFDRFFIENPDLPKRFAVGAKLNEGDRSTVHILHARSDEGIPGLCQAQTLDLAGSWRCCGKVM
ncbi:hypothetical protein L7F22_010547 [Adiantum nelumboides]|nr:hypothetical protein [Adiantum nelumboides]